MSIVSDAGPILSFARVNRLELLRQVVRAIVIPDAVYADIVVQGAGKPGSSEVQATSWITREAVKDRSFVDQLPTHLHLGEREAIALAKEHGASRLVDEREARRAASQLNIPVVGSLRVLKEAKDREIISQVKPILDELIAMGTYISDTLYHAFLRDAGEA
jgi:predicted nucleic acid-binding protein